LCSDPIGNAAIRFRRLCHAGRGRNMNEEAWRANPMPALSGGLYAVAMVARGLGVEVSAAQLARQSPSGNAVLTAADLVRSAQSIGLRARLIKDPSVERLRNAPVPAIVRLHDGSWWIYGGESSPDLYRLFDPVTREVEKLPLEEAHRRIAGELILVSKSLSMGAADFAFGISWFAPALKRYRKPLIEVIVVSFFINLLGLATPLCFELVVDKVIQHNSYSTLVVVTLALLVLALFNGLLKHLRRYILQHTAIRIDVELGARMFGHLVHLPLSYFETRAAGIIVTRARELINIRQFLAGQALLSGIDVCFIFIFFGVLFVYSQFIAFLVLLLTPLYVIIGALVRPPLKRLLKRKFRRYAATQQLMVESIVGMQTLKAAAVEPVFMRRWEERLSSFARVSFEATMLGVAASTTVSAVTKLSTAMVLYFGALQVMDGRMTVGGLIAFSMICRRMNQPIVRLAALWQNFQQSIVSVDHLADIFDSPVESHQQGAGVISQIGGAIELRKVSFRYRSDLPNALKQVSLRIGAGEMIGIVGPSGSGKSTLTKLLQRLYVPSAGELLLDGVDIMQLEPSWLRSQLGVVLQENFLFHMTVHENIALARPEMARSGVMRCARLAGADEFISQLPLGYDTVIEERGANLSGGQRQRLAIARALATNPRILILDEATSALDYESERIIQNNMERIARGRTVIIIAHRLAAVRKCDRIIGMYNGEIIEMGDHEQLLRRRGGLYAHLWALQNEQVE
jgi:subfamily B ATP-binding cassette protein HlyB/CyaB